MTAHDILDCVECNKFIKEEMQTIHFAGDYHDKHDKIISICERPTTIEEHREWLINEVHNRYIGKKDKIFLLGDVSFGSRVDVETKFLSRLNGEKVLITGNHDRNIDKSSYFSEIKQIKTFNFSRGNLNVHIELCHYPIASWNRKVYGSFNLHAHTHGRFVNSGLSWDVGIDNRRTLITSDGVELNNIYKPINLFQVCQIMSELSKTNDFDLYE